MFKKHIEKYIEEKYQGKLDIHKSEYNLTK